MTRWEQLVLTLVRTRKGFDVKFLADTFGINSSQVSRIYTTWITFLSQELSFLVPWPSRSELQKCLPKRFKTFKNVRVIIDCLELFIQKPKVPSSQKITWSNYKHCNTAKLLVGITPAYCQGPRLSAKGARHTHRVASLRTHAERNILKLKQFRILSGVVPLLLKPMLDRIIFVCAALTNLCPRSIK